MNINKKLLNKVFIKSLLTSLFSIFIILMPISASALSYQTSNYFGSQSSQAACDALNNLDSAQGCASKGGNASGTVTGLVSTIVYILSILIGAVAIIMIIVSGFKFMTSGGDSQRVSSAKSTLTYALIGLAVAALAQLLVSFVLTQSEAAMKPCPYDSTVSASDKAQCVACSYTNSLIASNPACMPCQSNTSISASDPKCTKPM